MLLVLTKLWRYFLTGGVAALIDLGLFLLLISSLLPIEAAAVGSFLVAALANYVLTSRFVFGFGLSSRRFFSFLGAAACGLLVNVGVTLAGASLLGMSLWAAKLLGIASAFFANFALNIGIVFRSSSVAESSIP